MTTLMATQARVQLWGRLVRVELYRAVARGETSRGTRATATWLLVLSVRCAYLWIRESPPARQTLSPAPGAATVRTERSGR